MDAVLESRWSRGHFSPGGGDAWLYYAVYGEFTFPLNMSSEKYRSDGLPQGLNLRVQPRDKYPQEFGQLLTGHFGALLDKQHNKAFTKRVRNAAASVLIEGNVADPPSLLYLRDVVGLITYFFDNGAEAVCDIQTLRWFDRETWRKYLFLPAAPVPRNHVVILHEPDTEPGAPRGVEWLHTRGMRKFGRPDLSVRRVPSHFRDAIVGVCNTLIDSMAFGIQVPEGFEARMATLPPGVRCYHGGGLDDPNFNNVHIDIRLPE